MNRRVSLAAGALELSSADERPPSPREIEIVLGDLAQLLRRLISLHGAQQPPAFVEAEGDRRARKRDRELLILLRHHDLVSHDGIASDDANRRGKAEERMRLVDRLRLSKVSVSVFAGAFHARVTCTFG